MKVSKLAVVLGLVFLAAAVTLVLLTSYGHLTLSESIQVGTLVVLVLITVWYADSTAKQVTATEKAVQVAQDAQRDGVMPIVELTALHGKKVQVTLRNLGTGPALNFRVWAKLRSEDGGVEATSGCSIGEAIGVGQKVCRTLDFSESHLDFGNRGDDLELVAEYTDIHKQGFRSTLRRRKLSYGRQSDALKWRSQS